VTAVEPEPWAERPVGAVALHEQAFGAEVLLRVGDGEDVVVRLAVGRRTSGWPRPTRARAG
jgi:hypothetical protein